MSDNKLILPSPTELSQWIVDSVPSIQIQLSFTNPDPTGDYSRKEIFITTNYLDRVRGILVDFCMAVKRGQFEGDQQ